MPAHTIQDLFDTFEEASTLPGRDVDQLKRYLREAGIIPPSGRSRSGPQCAPVHAAALIAGALLDVPMIRVAEALPRLWNAPAHGPPERYWKFTGDPEDLPLGGRRPQATLGQALELAIRAPYHPDPAERAAFRESFQGLEVRGQRGTAILRFANRSELIVTGGGSRTLTDNIGIETTKQAYENVFFALAEIVEQCRLLAAETGQEIPDAEAYAALAAAPPKIRGL